MYRDVNLFIDGAWRDASDGATLPVIDPATEAEIARVAKASLSDLDDAANAAQRGFQIWRDHSAYARASVLRAAAVLLRERATTIGRLLSLENGKPVAEAVIEIDRAADMIDWFAEEGRRAYGRVIPSRDTNSTLFVLKEPVGVVAAFTPWNFPVSQIAPKVGAALAAGCSVVLKGPEETPAAPSEFVRAFADAGLPPGVLNLVFGIPADISAHLIAHPLIRKISFTGSTAVGMRLASLAGQNMKRMTMELGGHAPVIVMADADIAAASTAMAAAKIRNAGQVCASPTRFLLQEPVYDSFMEQFEAAFSKVEIGSGSNVGSVMGPVAHERRLIALEDLVRDAVSKGATIRTGGRRMGNRGYFFEPTILTDMRSDMRIMNEEPFGPIALMMRFTDLSEALAEANRLPYGLSAFAWTTSMQTERQLIDRIEAGMLSINHVGRATPETPFGGVKNSGFGSEGGSEGIDAYLTNKLISKWS